MYVFVISCSVLSFLDRKQMRQALKTVVRNCFIFIVLLFYAVGMWLLVYVVGSLFEKPDSLKIRDPSLTRLPTIGEIFIFQKCSYPELCVVK